MSQTCERFGGLRARWVDGDIDAADALSLRLHLESCEACERDVREQREVRELLRARAVALRAPAPETLRQRVAAIVADGAAKPASNVVPMRPRAARPLLGTLRQWMPRSAAAAVFIAVAGVVAVGALAPRGSVLAAQMALDHLKCMVIAPTRPGVDAAEIEQQFREQRGWAVTVPPSAPALGLQLVGLRTCLYHDGHMAHVLYELEGKRVSLFVMPHREAAAAALQVFGQQTRAWSHDGRTYALVAAEESGSLDGVAAHFEANAR
jgi:anti-sigma factor RsiW